MDHDDRACDEPHQDSRRCYLQMTSRVRAEVMGRYWRRSRFRVLAGAASAATAAMAGGLPRLHDFAPCAASPGGHPQRPHRSAADRYLTIRGSPSQELFDLTWRI